MAFMKRDLAAELARLLRENEVEGGEHATPPDKWKDIERTCYALSHHMEKLHEAVAKKEPEGLAESLKSVLRSVSDLCRLSGNDGSDDLLNRVINDLQPMDHNKNGTEPGPGR